MLMELRNGQYQEHIEVASLMRKSVIEYAIISLIPVFNKILAFVGIKDQAPEA
jgi:hypothetical protein